MKKHLVLIFITAISLYSEVINRVVVTVNDRPVTMYDFNAKREEMKEQIEMEISRSSIVGKDAEQLRAEYSEDKILDRIIEDIVIEQEASRMDIDITENEITAAIRDRMREFGLTSMSDFELAIEQYGMNMADYRKQIHAQLLRQQLAGMALTVSEPSESEVRAYYEEHKEEPALSSASAVKVAWIMVEAPKAEEFSAFMKKIEKINKAREIVENGEDFSKVALEYSEHKASATNGGVLGTFTATASLPKPASYALAMVEAGKGVGDISAVQDSGEEGIWFVRIEAIESAGYEALKHYIKNLLYYEKMQTSFEKWLDKRKKIAVIRKID